MAFVYRARDCQLGNEVVIKVPRPGILEDPDFAGRFAREIRSLAKLSHPHIVKILGVGQEERAVFAVLPFLSGGSLRDRQPQHSSGAPQVTAARGLLGWLPQVADALDFMHARGYVHRDVKPDNILFDADSCPFLSDFGIVKALADNRPQHHQVVTAQGVVFGTAEYMAPEVIMGLPFDGRADQYALAVIIHELLTGSPPYEGPNPAAILVKQATHEPPSLLQSCPTLPAALAEAVQKALAKQPANRYTTCRALAKRIVAALGDGRETEGPVAPERIVRGTRALDVPPPPVVTCPGCGQRLRVPTRQPGQSLQCMACRAVFSHPGETLVPPPIRRPEQRTANDVAVGSGRSTKVRALVVSMGVVLGVLVTILLIVLLTEPALKLNKPHPLSRVQVSSAGPALPSVDPETRKPDAAPAAVENADPRERAAGPLSQGNERPEGRRQAPPHEKASLPADSPDVVKPPRTITNSIGMEFILIPAGTFLMGSPATEQGRTEDEHLHPVELTRSFYLGKYEVTLAQFRTFVVDSNYITEAEQGRGGWGYNALTRRFESNNPRYNWKNTGWVQLNDYPVVNVSWNDAKAFCDWLSRKEGKEYRLPTEAEWEYSCRAGTVTRFYSGDSANDLEGVANISDASFKQKYAEGGAVPWSDGYPFTSPTGRFKPNGFCLHDMHGNVCEWCADVYDREYYRISPRQDPQGPAPAMSRFRVARGGSCGADPETCRAAKRHRLSASYRNDDLGFRVLYMPAVSLSVGSLGNETLGTTFGQSGNEKATLLPAGGQKQLMPPTVNRDLLAKSITNAIGMQLVLIPAGEFTMGSPITEPGREQPEGPQHRVRISKAFYMGVYECRQREYMVVMGDNPSAFKVPNNPVERVLWAEAMEFCSKLSELPEEKKAGRRYRLPTEAEWEYACRAGTTTAFHFGNTLSIHQANFNALDLTSGMRVTRFGPIAKTVKAGEYKPNAWGIYDMHGNVYELVSDWFDEQYYAKSPPDDPKGPPVPRSYHVMRGGSWWVGATCCRSASRRPHLTPRDYIVGFRVAMDVK